MNILQYLSAAVVRSPDKPAFIEKDEICTFAKLQSDGLVIGAFLRANGIKSGDPVLILQPLSTNLYKALIGIWSIGAVAIVFDPSAGKAHINACCAIIRPAAFIGSWKAMLLGLYSKSIGSIPLKLCTDNVPFLPFLPYLPSFRRVLKSNGLRTNEQSSEHGSASALITFTSGSTGRPKAAVRSHAFLANQYETLRHSLDSSEAHIDLATLPIVALANLAAGMTTVIPNTSLKKINKIDAPAIVQQIIHKQVTRLVASPTFIRRLIEVCATNHIKLASLTHVYTGGGPVFPPLMEQIAQHIPNCRRYAVYGSTEAEPIAELDWSEVSITDLEHTLAGGGLLTGKPVAQIDCKIINATWGKPIGHLTSSDFSAICLESELVGEIVVSGNHVLKGYYNGIGDEENKFDVDGKRWHRTGDMGAIDRHGRLWLMGRAAAVIRDDRGTLYPFSVEAAIHSQFAVEQVAIVAHNGKRTLVLEQASRHLADAITLKLQWANLDRVVFLPKIPVDKRHHAKIDYHALMHML